MGSYLFGPIRHTKMHALAQRFLSVYKTENIKKQSYDSLLIEVNHLMDSKQTFSCFVVDIAKYCGVELPLDVCDHLYRLN